MRKTTFWLVVGSSLLPTSSFGADHLRQVWDYNLARVLQVPQLPAAAKIPVFALRFSPDGKHLAGIVGTYLDGSQLRSRLLILSTEQPESSPLQYEVESGVDDEADLSGQALFGWAQAGDVIQVKGLSVRLSDGYQCRLPYMSQFIGDGTAVGVERINSLQFSGTRLRLYDRECQVTEEWEVTEQWVLLDVSDSQNALLVGREGTGVELEELLVVDPFNRRVLHRWPSRLVRGNRFANNGKAICSGSGVYSGVRPPVECFAVADGKKIGDPPSVNGGLPLSVAMAAPRLVASDYHRRLSLLSDDLLISHLSRRVIWDFGSGRELFSWMPGAQEYAVPFANGKSKRTTDHFRFALSPDGDYLAEGGSGSLHLYRVEQ